MDFERLGARKERKSRATKSMARNGGRRFACSGSLSIGNEKKDETGRRAVDGEIRKYAPPRKKRSQTRPLCFLLDF